MSRYSESMKRMGFFACGQLSDFKPDAIVAPISMHDELVRALELTHNGHLLSRTPTSGGWPRAGGYNQWSTRQVKHCTSSWCVGRVEDLRQYGVRVAHVYGQRLGAISEVTSGIANDLGDVKLIAPPSVDLLKFLDANKIELIVTDVKPGALANMPVPVVYVGGVPCE